MSGSVQNVVIAGAGLAGWAAAAGLASSLRGSPVAITVVATDRGPTEPAAEFTLPSTRAFFASLGMSDHELLHETGATYRLGTEFIDWPVAGQRRSRWFGQHGAQIGFIPFHHYAARRRLAGNPIDYDAYSANAVAAREGRFGGDRSDVPMANRIEYGLCMDRAACTRLLRRLALSAGVREAHAALRAANRRVDGGIASLALADDATLRGDLFLDCTGDSACLIGDTLGEETVEDAADLPFDRLLSVPASIPERLVLQCAAEGDAWLLDVSCGGGGYHALLYAHEQFDDRDAFRCLQDSRPCDKASSGKVSSFGRGIRERAWRRNCIALGAAAGMAAPLIASELHWITEDILRLLRLFPADASDAHVAQEYNAQRKKSYANFRDYLLVQYAASESASAIRSRPALPPGFERRRALFECAGRVLTEDHESFAAHEWAAAWLSAGIWPAAYDPLLERMGDEELDGHFNRLAAAIARDVAALPEYAARQ